MLSVVFRSAIMISLILCAVTSWGAQIRAYVPPFAVTGAQNRDELKGVLQTLLSSRLTGEGIIAVDTPASADITVSGSYLVFGKIFSLDAVARNSGGSVLTRAFIQGDSQDELIPAISKLARTLIDDLSKLQIPVTTVPAASVPLMQAKAGPSDVEKNQLQQSQSEIIRPQLAGKQGSSGWISQRLAGALNGIAQGRDLKGEREIFVTGTRSLRYYLQGKDLKLVAEINFPGNEKILSVDTGDLDEDGIPEIYLTMMDGDYLASQVWQPGKNTLIKLADKLQYFFRGVALYGKEKRIYAQERGLDVDFYGDVYELVKSGKAFSLKNPIKMPKFGNIFNFNAFTDSQGKKYLVAFHPDGYLLVFSEELEQLWKSSDKFGGSESHFRRLTNPAQISLSRYIFLDQRIVVTGDGQISVPQNSGFFVVGDSRSYSKSSIVSFSWNGSSLEENWRTRQSQNYLADYAYDEPSKELILLEVVQKEGLVAKGASAISVKKVE